MYTLNGVSDDSDGDSVIGSEWCLNPRVLFYFGWICHCGERCIVLRSRKNKMGFAPKVKF